MSLDQLSKQLMEMLFERVDSMVCETDALKAENRRLARQLDATENLMICGTPEDGYDIRLRLMPFVTDDLLADDLGPHATREDAVAAIRKAVADTLAETEVTQ